MHCIWLFQFLSCVCGVCFYIWVCLYVWHLSLCLSFACLADVCVPQSGEIWWERLARLQTHGGVQEAGVCLWPPWSTWLQVDRTHARTRAYRLMYRVVALLYTKTCRTAYTGNTNCNEPSLYEVIILGSMNLQPCHGHKSTENNSDSEKICTCDIKRYWYLWPPWSTWLQVDRTHARTHARAHTRAHIDSCTGL